MQIIRCVLPGRKSYEEELPASASPSVSPASAVSAAAAAFADDDDDDDVPPPPPPEFPPSPSACASLSPTAAVVPASLSVSAAAVLSPSLAVNQLSPDSIALLMAEMAAMRLRTLRNWLKSRRTRVHRRPKPQSIERHWPRRLR
jgi:hypothetical protein